MRLDEVTLRRIGELREQGLSVRAIARETGVHRSSVGRAVVELGQRAEVAQRTDELAAEEPPEHVPPTRAEGLWQVEVAAATPGTLQPDVLTGERACRCCDEPLPWDAPPTPAGEYPTCAVCWTSPPAGPLGSLLSHWGR